MRSTPTHDHAAGPAGTSAYPRGCRAVEPVVQPIAAEVADLRRLFEVLGEMDRCAAEAVALAGRVEGAGTCERVEGLPLEWALGLLGRVTGPDRRMLLAAADVLGSMPCVARLFYEEAGLSWSQVRSIVAQVSGLPVDQRTRIDQAVAAHLEGVSGLVAPEAVLGAVDAAVMALDQAGTERDEAAAIEGSFVAVQADLWGGSRVYAQLDAELTATFVTALDAAADAPVAGHRHPCDEPDCVAPACAERAPARPARSRAQQRADGLGRICHAFLSGGRGGGRARPTLVVHADAEVLLDRDGAAQLDRPLPGQPVWLSAETARRLACDTRMVTVTTGPDGTVAVGRERDVVPKRLRAALSARDGGCRFPGCYAPVAWTDAHHIRHRADGGATTLSNLVLLCRRCHSRVHHQRWLVTLHDDGGLTVRRSVRGRVYTSLPRRLRRLTLASPAGSDDPAATAS